jgi:hypothetical protein
MDKVRCDFLNSVCGYIQCGSLPESLWLKTKTWPFHILVLCSYSIHKKYITHKKEQATFCILTCSWKNMTQVVWPSAPDPLMCREAYSPKIMKKAERKFVLSCSNWGVGGMVGRCLLAAIDLRMLTIWTVLPRKIRLDPVLILARIFMEMSLGCRSLELL